MKQPKKKKIFKNLMVKKKAFFRFKMAQKPKTSISISIFSKSYFTEI